MSVVTRTLAGLRWLAGLFCEADGALSARRVLAALFALSTLRLFSLALELRAEGWTAFIPGLATLTATLLLLFFTTWADIAGIVKAAKDD